MAPLKIDNKTARALWLDANLLLDAPTGPLDIEALVSRLGFVQIDTIRNVTRAHNHILWSRNRKIREGMLWRGLKKRAFFEHFTHDASVLPMDVYPLWQRQFARLGAKTRGSDWYAHGMGDQAEAQILARIEAEGALSTHAFDTKADNRQMWARPPHKKALDMLWYGGVLSTCHRRNFVKFYDLSTRVIPDAQRRAEVSDDTAVAKLCTGALDRLGFAKTGEVKRFWDAVTPAEVKTWQDRADTVPLQIENADGTWGEAIGAPDIEDRLARLGGTRPQMRILNPFDPAIRDRDRALRLFGFHYRNEMFVPANKRIFGYYVYPLLEGDRFVGRLEATGNRETETMTITGFWPEPGTRWGRGRGERLARELIRFARLAGMKHIHWVCEAPLGA